MKNRFLTLLIIAALSLAGVSPICAGNKYLWTFDNFQATSMGGNVIRFTLPVWVYGKGSNHTEYLSREWNIGDPLKDSYIVYSEVQGDFDNAHRIMTFGADRGNNYDCRETGYGYSYAYVHEGSCIVRNMYNGVPVTLTAGDDNYWHNSWLTTTRQNTSYVDHVLFLVVDWYMPTELEGKTIYIGLHTFTFYANDGSVDGRTIWDFWPGSFYGGDMPQSPQLFEPYFYSVATDKQNNIGKAAMQYMTFQDPISYHTSLNAQEQTISEKSGTVLVDMQDSVQDNFYGTFNVWINKDAQLSQQLQSNRVLIPAYHKIYDVDANEVQDSHHCVTGEVELAWRLEHPDAQDIMESDVFEVQRATKEDFSDAETVGVYPMLTDSGVYRVTDPAKAVLTALLDTTKIPSSKSTINSYKGNIEVADTSRRYAIIEAELRSSVKTPGHPLYYRIRRASAASWGWKPSSYMAETMLLKSNYLAPLADTQTEYTLDPAFEENRVVHFNIKIDNALISHTIPDIDSVQFDFTPTSVYGMTGTIEQIKQQIALHINLDSIKNMLYQDLVDKIHSVGVGRCQWDENARLILSRKLVETGDVYEMIIPTDSIKVQDDGSYMVHVTDIADQSCVHYEYSVRIDQSNALLHVQYDRQLDPIALSGPDLYNNKGGELTAFSATIGTDKRGVVLTWERTAGSIDYFILERRMVGASAYDTLATVTDEGYFDEHIPYSHEVVPGKAYDYRLTSFYTCHGMTTTSTKSTKGSRSPYGSIAGRIAYADGSGCCGIKVQLSQDSLPDITAFTDEKGNFLFDSLLYGTSTTYAVTPVSETAQFRFNNTDAASASVTLTANNNEAKGLAFENISSVILSGRALYKLSSVPVRDANLLLNGKLVMKFNEPLKTDVSGNFELRVPQNSAFTLQVIKDGHTFENNGFVREYDSDSLTLSKDLPGVRVWDMTKVRLSGRVVGGLDQASLPLGQGLSKNNLGDNIQLVLELEGDNTAYIVRDPQDLTKDTLEYQIGNTKVHYQHKRIIIEPDSATGEYEADLFPVKYKIVQATAEGYATLFAKGKTSEIVDLSAAKPDSFSVIYRAPIEVTYKQSQYGMEYDYCGVKTWTAQTILGQDVKVDLAVPDSATGQWTYLFGAPVFPSGDYQFRVTAHENYYYNNDRTREPDIVYLKGGKLKIYNGLRASTEISEQPLDNSGAALVNVTFDHITLVQTGDSALHSLDFSVETDGAYVTSTPLRAYVLGGVEKPSDFLAKEGGTITLLDILRDPPGSGSYAYLEKGTSYHVKYKVDYNYRFGLDLQLSYGNNNQYFIGTYAGTPAGATAGMLNVVQETTTWNLPVSIQFTGKSQADYTFTTNERIQTGSGPLEVGAMGDVFIGVTNGVLTGKADAFRVVDSISYEMLKGQIDNRNVMVVKRGFAADGQPWYLMRTEDVLIKQTIQSSFAYTQSHIINTIIPQLFYHRNSMLLTGSRDDAVAYAEMAKKPVYWSKVPTDSLGYGEDGYYELIKPSSYSGLVIDEVNATNHAIDSWLKVLETNEREKVNSQTETPLQTLSVSGGMTQSYTESYAYAEFRSSYVGYPLVNRQTGVQGGGAGGFIVGQLKRLFSSETMTALEKHLQQADKSSSSGKDLGQYLKAEVGEAKIDFHVDPIIDMSTGNLPENGLTEENVKTTGYTIAPGTFEHLTFNVYKSKVDVFNDDAETLRHAASDFDSDNKDKYLFGSLMYRTLGGATVCPWEGADSTYFYNSGTPLNMATQKIENPQITLNRHEASDVPYDQPARFTITMWNEADETVGMANGVGVPLRLRLDDTTNPYGAKISVDGVPLGDGREFIFYGNQPVIKTIEVQAGEAYNYEDICLILESECMPLTTYQKACLSVHYMPVSCPVNISVPSDKWILNTLSPRDKQGYYMPVSIDGFDVNYDNFDHIELQYKQTTQSNDAWVNLCSYFADDSLYQSASGTKQMIKNGKIEHYRFYGENDPVEQKYDLRAVSFCRHGSGFITKSSPVLTGTKDTRPPRVFGQPEPADAILGVGNNLLLRFNEPIAGNYLDEDNNFQIIGYTNETGITTGVSLYFDGTDNSYALSKVQRTISNKSFTVDMLVRPTNPHGAETFLTYEMKDGLKFSFGKTEDDRLTTTFNKMTITSLPIEEPMTAFMRVLFIYDQDQGGVHFYAGTEDITDTAAVDRDALANIKYSASAPICIGKGFEGNMKEVRLWTKALTTEEVAQTHMTRLTGYERELLAYYPMDEGSGEILTDKANGATLYTTGTAWEHQPGISLHIADSQLVIMDGNLMSRSEKQDETLIFWFKTAVQNGSLFRAGWVAPTDTTAAKGTLICLNDGNLYFNNNNNQWRIASNVADDSWHHFVMTVSRTYNNVALYLDGRLLQNFDADQLGAVSGDMFLGGDGFEGNIDEFTIFEQALPQSLMTSYGSISPTGEEMGLMAYLPFSEMKENESGILEQVFSVNDQRVFKTSEGDIVEKVQPLITGITDGTDINDLGDKTQSAPVEDLGQLTKIKFDWAFNNDELMININMRDWQINKQQMYITVRNVEDLNGNPMVSPVSWTAFVDRNALKWAKRNISIDAIYGPEKDPITQKINIINHSGKRHQYTIESLADWLSVDEPSGSIDPTNEISVTFTFSPELSPGEYCDVVYLTDEDGLSEPLHFEYTVEALPPYDEVDNGKYPLNMSICGQVLYDGAYDIDASDIVYAFYYNECVGMATIDVDDASGISRVYLTVYGNETMNNKPIVFQLWESRTGKLVALATSVDISFAHGNIYGCGNEEPVIFTDIGSQTQNIDLNTGWSWISFNVDVEEKKSLIKEVMTAAQPWTDGDIIKNPATKLFVSYSKEMDAFIGMFNAFDYHHMYMVYAKNGNTMRVSGEQLTEDKMTVTLKGNGAWSPLPCLLSETTYITDALAGYYDNATPGDLIKSHDRFAVFSANKHWEGNLKSLRPGEGYLFRRLAQGDVNVPFYNQSVTPQQTMAKANANANAAFTNPQAATNMTMIAAIEGLEDEEMRGLEVYINDELVGKAEPLSLEVRAGEELFYFLTIQSDIAGELRFKLEDGTPLSLERVKSSARSIVRGTVVEHPGERLLYEPDSHWGSLEEPLILTPANKVNAYKIIENNNVLIIRNNEKYDVTGKKL